MEERAVSENTRSGRLNSADTENSAAEVVIAAWQSPQQCIWRFVMRKMIDTLSNILMCLVSVILVILVVFATIQVITRYFIAVQVIWIEEVSIYLVTWIAAFGIPWMWLRQGHIRMDVLNFILPEKALRISDYLINLIACAASAGVIRVGIVAIRVNTGYVLSVIRMDEGLRYYPVLAAGILLLVSSVLVLGKMLEEDMRRKKHAV